jgi:hypothetical protein
MADTDDTALMAWLSNDIASMRAWLEAAAAAIGREETTVRWHYKRGNLSRPTRIDEAIAIADLFDVSLDALAQANEGLAAIWPPLRDGLLAASTEEAIRDQVADMVSDDKA